jgi:iron complex transport system ATP-binding protein
MSTINSKNNILKTGQLTIGYQSKKALTIVLENINISIPNGALVGLVGGNGSGKSTLIRTLTKVQAPISGDIFLNEKTLNDYTPIDLAKTISLVLTEPLFSKNLSVEELVALGRQPYTNWIGKLSKVDKQLVNLALEQVDLESIRHKKCFELSDGQLQRVMIARAIAQDTDLIILDEPTTHLDLYHKAFIFKLMKQLVDKTGKTILFSTHEIDLAIQLCDYMIVLDGNTCQISDPCQLIENDAFSKLFPKDMIVFDKQSASFKVQKPN